jgi:c-di-GMP-binding flagellar brake protein YcgR
MVKAALVGEARSHRRLSDALMLVAYSIGEEFAPAHTEAYDLGMGGLAMLSSGELPPGAALTLRLELRGDPRPIDKYRIGIEFTDRAPEQEQQLLGYIDTMYKLRDLGVF